MKKKLFALAIAAAIALVVVPLAFAAAKPQAKGKPFLAKGTVVSVDTTTTTLVVAVARGSDNMKPFGTEVTFTLAAGSQIFARTVGRHGKVHFKKTTLDKVTPGSKVNINGRVDRRVTDAPVYFAQHIVVKLAPAPSPTATAIPSAAAAF